MKITIEPYSGGTYTASNDAEHISEVIKMFRGLLVQVGYHPQTVDEYFNDEDRWFEDKKEAHTDEEVEHFLDNLYVNDSEPFDRKRDD